MPRSISTSSSWNRYTCPLRARRIDHRARRERRGAKIEMTLRSLRALRALWLTSLMNILFTAGNTQAPIDRVRAITNIFTGRTGTNIALAAHQRGHRMTLLTSHPELAGQSSPVDRWTVEKYQTFDE